MTAHNIFETISSQYFQLTNSEKKVADYVLRHRIDVQYMSISELAEECTVADATISRFCRRLGLTGYNAFKLELAKASMTRDSHRADAAILQESSGFHAMCKKLLGENVAVLEQTIQLLDPRQVSRAVDLLRRSRRVVCMGQGSSMVLSEEAWTLFSTVSPKFLFVPDSHLQMNTLALMDPDELVLFFSYSGSTRDFQDLLEVARVVKGLTLRDAKRSLSTGERKMLHSAKEILISEIVLSQSCTYEDVEARINTALN